MPSIALRTALLSWRVCRGRNGWDAPSILDEDMGADAINVRLVRGKLPVKRYGTVGIDLQPNGYNALARFIPAQNDAAAELFIVDRSATPQILRVTMAMTRAGAALTLADPIETRPQDVHTAALNGKLFLAYNSGVNRLHVYDPKTSTTTVRRTGLSTGGAIPNIQNEGSGTYPATYREYRIQWLVLTGGTVQRQSPLGPALGFIPSGTGGAVRVYRPAPAEGVETHWIVWASSDGQAFYQLSGRLPLATPFYDDTTAPADYADGIAAPPEGSFTNWPSVKFLVLDRGSLAGYGA